VLHLATAVRAPKTSKARLKQKKKVKQYRYRPGQALRVPEG